MHLQFKRTAAALMRGRAKLLKSIAALDPSLATLEMSGWLKAAGSKNPKMTSR